MGEIDPYAEVVALLDEMSRPGIRRHVGTSHLFCPVCNHLVTSESETGRSREGEPRIDCARECLGFRARRALEKLQTAG